ncbi:hypothetical protein COV20_00255 [Candidatus Woesearchaeota archaeon CG10_big_fil_rev_8_21_14_0_10_45_16]|nr:MAG: hypothetical protein COV20_00255 [Candidatus Woesearchaeota archaeon CG10_big_fil_rev_8_21_14_0_10_45_16]
MNKKNFNISIFFVILIMSGLLVFGALSLMAPQVGSPIVNFANLSGTITLNASNQSFAVNNGSSNGHITNVTFSWGLSSHTSIILNTTIFNTTVNQTTGFINTSFDTTLLSDGNYNLTVSVYNASGARNSTSFSNITVDNTAPVVTLSNASFITNSQTPSVYFNFTDLQTLANCTLYVNGMYNASNYTALNYSVTILSASGLSTSGVYVTTVNCTDFSNNTGNSTAINITVDLSAPKVAFVTANNSNVSSGLVAVNLSVTDASLTGGVVVLQVSNNSNPFNVSVTTNASGNWNTNLNVSRIGQGNHSIRAFVNDTFNQMNSTVFLNFTVDRQAPTVGSIAVTSITTDSASLSLNSTDNFTGVASCTFTGARDGALGGTVASSSYSVGLTSLDSSTDYNVSVTCTDFAGNTQVNSTTFTTSTATTTSSSSGGSSGGSVSSTVSGQFKKEVWNSVNSDENTVLVIDNGAIGVTQVSFEVNKETFGAWMEVRKLDKLPSNIQSFTRDVYRFLQITERNIENVLKGSAVVNFKVEKAWLRENGLNNDRVALFRNVDGKWVQLETKMTSSDDTYVHFEAQTPGFSYFVIGEAEQPIATSAAADEAAPGSEAASETAEQPAAGEEAMVEEGGSSLGITLLVLAIVVVIGFIGYSLLRKKR